MSEGMFHYYPPGPNKPEKPIPSHEVLELKKDHTGDGDKIWQAWFDAMDKWPVHADHALEAREIIGKARRDLLGRLTNTGGGAKLSDPHSEFSSEDELDKPEDRRRRIDTFYEEDGRDSGIIAVDAASEKEEEHKHAGADHAAEKTHAKKGEKHHDHEKLDDHGGGHDSHHDDHGSHDSKHGGGGHSSEKSKGGFLFNFFSFIYGISGDIMSGLGSITGSSMKSGKKGGGEEVITKFLNGCFAQSL